MSATQIRCQGCNRNFTTRGLSQHMSKTQDSRCRAVYATSQLPSVSTYAPHTVSPTDPIPAPSASGADVPCDEDDTLVANDGAFSPVAPVDQADVTDTDTFEALTHGDYPSMVTPPDRATVDDPTGALEQEYIQIDAEDSDSESMVVIDKFPFGSPGAPIPGVAQGSSAYQSHLATVPDSVWAPFRSQCDWEVACWAKMRGPTSSAVTELLAIPAVRAYYFHCYVAESMVLDCRYAWPFLSHCQPIEHHY